MGRMAEMQRKLLEVRRRFTPDWTGSELQSTQLTLLVIPLLANDGTRSYGCPTDQCRLVGPKSMQELYLWDLPTRYLW